jgi:cellulose synthase/poly-beta-1,6-N-acetylglucosamine synthase-like glycosyltransferase
MAVNYRYARKRSSRDRDTFRPRTVLIVPCKGIDHTFQANITSLYYQDYKDYVLWFVVESSQDPAYAQLCQIRDRIGTAAQPREVAVFIAGRSATSSQKIHNLLHCIDRLPPDAEVIAFADSDAYLRSNWLKHLVHPLSKDKVGVATGYRWFVPKRNNLATLALSAINAKIAQLLGAYRFNQAWGGSMAVRVSLFRELEIEKAWRYSVSDDLVLSYLMKKAGKKITFVPACLVASYEQTTWPALFEFARRQFLITRVSLTRTWLLGFTGSVISNFALLGGALVAFNAWRNHAPHLWLLIALPTVFLLDHMLLAALRQHLIALLLPDDRKLLRAAKWADILGAWFFSIVLFVIICSSAMGRRIKWRGIEYRLVGPTQTVILNAQQQSPPVPQQDISGSCRNV